MTTERTPMTALSADGLLQRLRDLWQWLGTPIQPAPAAQRQRPPRPEPWIYRRFPGLRPYFSESRTTGAEAGFTLGDVIRATRRRKRMTQAILAIQSGLNERTISRVENGADLSPESARAICAVLEIDLPERHEEPPQRPALRPLDILLAGGALVAAISLLPIGISVVAVGALFRGWRRLIGGLIQATAFVLVMTLLLALGARPSGGYGSIGLSVEQQDVLISLVGGMSMTVLAVTLLSILAGWAVGKTWRERQNGNPVMPVIAGCLFVAAVVQTERAGTDLEAAFADISAAERMIRWAEAAGPEMSQAELAALDAQLLPIYRQAAERFRLMP